MSLTLFVQDLRSRVANKNAAINGVNSLRASIVDMIPNGVIKFVNALFDSALEVGTFKEEKVWADESDYALRYEPTGNEPAMAYDQPGDSVKNDSLYKPTGYLE